MINEFEKGIGIAGFLLSISIFSVLIKNNFLSIEETAKVIDGAKEYVKHPDLFFGDSKTLASADAALGAAQDLLIRLATGKASA
jgi:hypothetical protein